MVKLVSKILTVVLMLNLVVCVGVGAQEQAKFYIDGDKEGIVAVTGSDGALLFALSDIERLGLSYTVLENGICVTNGSKTASLFVESSVVLVDGESAAFYNALYAADGQVQGVNADLLCSIFGFEYSYINGGAAISTRRTEVPTLDVENFARAAGSALATDAVVSGQVILPAGQTADESIPVTVQLRETSFPYSVAASALVRIPDGGRQADFSLAMPGSADGFWLSYQTDRQIDGLFNSGYYTDAGTSIDKTQATLLTGGAAGLQFTLIPTREVHASVTMPAGQTAQHDIQGTVYVVPSIGTESSNSSYFISSDADMIIEQGADSGEVVFRVPVQDNILYKLGIRFLTGDNTVYSTAYYGESGTTSSKQLATLTSNDTQDINIALLGKRTISGRVENASQVCEITAIGQDDPGQRKDLDNTLFYTKAYSSEVTGAFSLDLPADMTDYIIGVKYAASDSSYTCYYTADGLVNDIGEADLVHTQSDGGGIVIDAADLYAGLPINLLAYTQESGGIFYVGYENVSETPQNGVSAIAAYYGSDDRLLGVSKSEKDIAAGEMGTFEFSTASAASQEISEVKVFVWDDALNPVSRVKTVDWSIDTEIYQGVYINNDKYDVEPGGLLYTCGALMTSKEVAAQLLGLDVSENGDTVTLVKGDTRVTLTKNSLAATVNSEMYRLDAMPMQVGSSLAIPFISVAKYFGYPTNYYNKTSGYLYLL